MNEPSFFWDIGMLPFLWGSLDSPTNGEVLPDQLPFKLKVDHNTGVLSQVYNPVVSEALNFAYDFGSMISEMMDEEGLGKKYADDFLKYILESYPGYNFKQKKILEIGCGTGYLLHKMKEMGADVLGIEPGAHGQEGSIRYGVPIIRDSFSQSIVHEKFDLVIAYAVLEHIENPKEFLEEISGVLKNDGKLLLSVPDCGPYLEHGDISLLFHEHWSYFTEDTLRGILNNFSVLNISSSGFGGALYATAGLSNNTPGESIPLLIEESINQANAFRARSEINAKHLSKFVTDALNKTKTIGIYVPSRAINTLISQKIPLEHCRFFDDNNLLHGTYFPGIDIQIESRDMLINNPTDLVLVLSHSFGSKIVNELEKAHLPHTEILNYDQIFTKSI